jgi:hypothetical protein
MAFAQIQLDRHATAPKNRKSKNRKSEDSVSSTLQLVMQAQRLRKFGEGFASLRTARFRPLCQYGNILQT